MVPKVGWLKDWSQAGSETGGTAHSLARRGFRYLWNDSWTYGWQGGVESLLTSENLQNHRPHSILRDAKSFSQVCRVTDLGCVERWVTGPLKHVLVDVAIISSEDRIQLPVVEVEGVDQRHGVGSQLTEQFLDTSRNLQHLGHRQQSSLRKRKQKWVKTRPTQTTCRRANNTTVGGTRRA